MIRLLLLHPVLSTAAGGGDAPDEHTVWEDEDEAREAALEAAESGEGDEAPVVADD